MNTGRDYQEAVDRLNEMKADRTTPAAELAGKIGIAREAVRIEAVRLAEARHAEATERATEMRAKAAALRGQENELHRKAEHMRTTAEGTLRGLYGDAAPEVLLQRGIRPLKVTELETEANRYRDQADTLEDEAKRTAPPSGAIARAVSELIQAAVVEV
jgi:hypothetical protein